PAPARIQTALNRLAYLTGLLIQETGHLLVSNTLDTEIRHGARPALPARLRSDRLDTEIRSAVLRSPT
ncbi:hypothetical protein C1I95_33790, partial [Micromonospora craterilacus]